MTTGRSGIVAPLVRPRPVARKALPNPRAALRDRPTLLTLLILIAGSRTATRAYPTLGFIEGGTLTPTGRLIWPALAFASAVAMYHSRRPVRWPNRYLLAVVATVAVSMLWSADIPRTAYQTLVLASIVVCATYVVSCHTPERCFLIVAGYLATVSTIIALAALLRIGPPLTRGGLMEHKNLLGALTAATVLACAVAATITRRRARRAFIAAATIAAAVMIICESRSGVFSLFAGGTAISYLRLARRSPGHITAATTLFGVVAAGIVYRLVGGIAGILDASGKDLTLTGRTEIWRYVLDLAANHRTFGWGYFAIWGERPLGGNQTPAYVVLDVRSSHSGYIEMYVGVGLLGVAVLLIALAALLRASLRRAWRLEPVGRWALALTVFAIVQNLSESVVPGTVQTMVFLLLLLATADPPDAERRTKPTRSPVRYPTEYSTKRSAGYPAEAPG